MERIFKARCLSFLLCADAVEAGRAARVGIAEGLHHAVTADGLEHVPVSLAKVVLVFNDVSDSGLGSESRSEIAPAPGEAVAVYGGPCDGGRWSSWA